MKVRLATREDTLSIVELLKLSLGESLLPKSVEYWNWKHVNNPFGESPVLLAEEDEQLVGVRAFMRWNWKGDHKIYQALRAVDTATHPEFQGKGIFKKLTTQLLEKCNSDGFDFVFNTPNDKSRPGYLKMGWIEACKLKVSLQIKPFNVLSSAGDKKLVSDYMMGKVFQKDSWENFDFSTLNIGFSTPKDYHYLKWRYDLVPVQDYFAIGDAEKGHLMIFSLKRRSYFLELRINELIITNKESIKVLSSQFKQVTGLLKPLIISAAPSCGKNEQMFLDRLMNFKSISVGPLVTLRQLNTEVEGWRDLEGWNYSLGDFELF